MPFDGANLSQVKRDLIAARELLITDGWVPRCGSSMRGPNCIATAIGVTAKGEGSAKAMSALYPILRAQGWYGIGQFNDAQTSIEPVLALLDEAIAAA